MDPGRDGVDAVEPAAERLLDLGALDEVVDASLDLALELTHSSVAFLSLEADGDERHVYTRAADPLFALADADVERVVGRPAGATWGGGGQTGAPLVRTTCVQTLRSGGRVLGFLGVGSTAGYTAQQARTLAALARHVAPAILIGQLSDRRKEMVDTLVNLRAELDRSERQRLVTEERAHAAERVERAHEASVEVLLQVSRHARSGFGLADFHRHLSRSVAELVGADKVLFWKCDNEGRLAPLRGGFGVDDDFLAGLEPVDCDPDGDDLASRVVYRDLPFRASRADSPPDHAYVLDRLGVSSAIAVAWRAGDERLGLVAAYESRRRDGFSREDTWVLQKAGLAAALVFQLRYAHANLRKTAERLEKVDAARQILLHNVSTAVDTERKRLAGDLHDDALQKLTAAELQLQRLREADGDAGGALLAEAQALLSETEDALRKVLFETRPPLLDMPGGFAETVRERVRMLRSLTDAEVELEIDVPEELTPQFRSTLFRQLTEALTNVEKHASAKNVWITIRADRGGIACTVRDDGRGFVVAERQRLPGHLGLLALDERALLAGGWNRVTSQPGSGTRVEFWLPVKAGGA